MDVDLEAIRDLVRNASPGSTLLVAPDVYTELAHGCSNLEQEAFGIIGRHSIQIRRSPQLKPGTAMIMAAAHIPPPQDWASGFLNKGGPAAQSMSLGLVVPPEMFSKPAPAPEPVSVPKPHTRQRIVDT